MRSDESLWSSEQGFDLTKTLVSVGLLTAVSIAVTQLFVVAALANYSAKVRTPTSVLAVEKMERLTLTWGSRHCRATIFAAATWATCSARSRRRVATSLP